MMFAADVKHASDQGMAAGGPRVCARALPAVEVASTAAAGDAVRNYAAMMIGVAGSDLMLEDQMCGVPNTAPCANIFDLYAGGLGGQVSRYVYPLAQRVDAEAAPDRLILLTRPGQGDYDAVVLYGVRDGYLMGVALFADCSWSG